MQKKGIGISIVIQPSDGAVRLVDFQTLDDGSLIQGHPWQGTTY